jgi:hypothetical protein
MEYIPCRDRVFYLQLAPQFVEFYETYMYWLKHLIERLGRESTLKIWQVAFNNYDDKLLQEILSYNWEEVKGQEPLNIESEIDDLVSEIFPTAVESVSADEAKNLIDTTPPFTQIMGRFPSLDVSCKISTYHALHLFFDGLALLTETLIDLHGKQGELIAYDALMARWTERQPNTIDAAEFLKLRTARFSAELDEPDMFSAGLDVDLIRATETEVVTRVNECEWARYYQDHHPRVGYMLACSLDNAAYKSFDPLIRLQRTCTIMEGGGFCDFRVYSLDEDNTSGN